MISKKVIIAMSGGVDSSVAAYLLKKQGYNVTGEYLRLFKDEKREKQAKGIAEKIGIPLIIKDARKEFKKKVIDYFIGEYKAGGTPNPCVVCNREIKFKFLFQELLKLKADYVATGHYARLRREILNPKSEIRNKSKIKNSKLLYKLFEAKDKTKDQSYFLYTLNRKRLSKILFPLGNYAKKEVKKLAKKLNLPVSDSEESQSICFIAEKWPDEFLKRNIKMKPGNIIEINGNKIDINRNKAENGNIIGRHQGLPLYTVGQRRNIRIGGTGPYYVARKNFRKNELKVVKNFNDPLLYRKELLVKNVNWTLNGPRFPLKAKICIRYHHPAVSGIIKEVQSSKFKVQSNFYKVQFVKPQRAVTPGQAAVFYSDKGELLGGGTITNQYKLKTNINE